MESGHFAATLLKVHSLTDLQRRFALRSGYFGFATLCLAGCTEPSALAYNVAGHEFRIPREFIVTDTIAWLPAGDDAPLLVLNPGAPLQDHILVLLQPVSAACAGVDENDKGYAVDLCRQREASKPLPQTLKVHQLRKVADKVHVTWQYYDDQASGGSRFVAACNASTANPKWGMCTHLYRRGNILVNVDLDEDQLPLLPAIHRNLDKALAQWEIR